MKYKFTAATIKRNCPKEFKKMIKDYWEFEDEEWKSSLDHLCDTYKVSNTILVTSVKKYSHFIMHQVCECGICEETIKVYDRESTFDYLKINKDQLFIDTKCEMCRPFDDYFNPPQWETKEYLIKGVLLISDNIVASLDYLRIYLPDNIIYATILQLEDDSGLIVERDSRGGIIKINNSLEYKVSFFASEAVNFKNSYDTIVGSSAEMNNKILN
nr:hypothetical protein [Nonlabens ulvanivorans]